MTTNSTKGRTMKNIFITLAIALLAVPALAQDATEVVNIGSAAGWAGLGVGLMMGIAVLGGTLGQSNAANAALEGIARNPAASGKLTVPLILSLALMESLVLFAFLIALQLTGAITTVLRASAQ